VCSTKDAENRVTSIFFRHGLRSGQGYFAVGPFQGDPNVYLTINISLAPEKIAQIQAEVRRVSGAAIQS